MPRPKLDPDFHKILLCPDCGGGHVAIIGHDTPYPGYINIIVRCFECEKVNTLYAVNDGTLTIIEWAGKEEFRKKQEQVRKHKREMAALGVRA